jgi:hypothetical protein
VGNLATNLTIFVVVKVVGVSIENTITPKSTRLMNLKVKTYRRQDISLLPSGAMLPGM